MAMAVWTDRTSAQNSSVEFRDFVQPFLVKHCTDCHGKEDPEAKLSLDAIDGNIPTGRDIETWKRVAERLALGEMPPEDADQPDPVLASKVLDWIKAELFKGGEDVSEIGRKLILPGHGNRVNHEALFSGKVTGPVASPSRLWRLRPQIYVSFVPRITRDAKVGQPFSSHSGAGFKDYSELFVVDEPTVNQLMRNAKSLVAQQCGDGRGRALREFENLLKVADKPDERAEPMRIAIRKQFQVALLREPTEEETARFATLMETNIKDAGPAIGVKSTLAAILMLPEAIYRFELGRGERAADGRVMLSPRELAYAIAFALTDQAPDRELAKSLQEGRLNSTDDVRREVARILDDPKLKKSRVMRFFEEYFEFTAAEDVFKDLPRGKWRPDVLINDTRMLIQHILDQDRDVLKQLLTTNECFVNCRLDPKQGLVPARIVKKKQPKKDKKTGRIIPVPPRDPFRQIEIHDFYSLPLDWEWEKKQPVRFPANERAGILTQPSWLAAFASNNENHAIQRGKWIRERLLGGVVPDLPISVDARLPDAPDQPLRQRMEITKQEYCWQCHKRMNQLGLMLEHYDFLGRYRQDEPIVDLTATAKNVDSKGNSRGTIMTGVPVDASGSVTRSGDARIDGDYRDIIPVLHKLADSPRVRQVFVRHAFRFWMGRNETLNDSPTLIAADDAYVKSGGSMNALITSLLTSDSFLYRTAAAKSPQNGNPESQETNLKQVPKIKSQTSHSLAD